MSQAVDAARNTQVDRNIDLAFDLAQAIVADPTLADEIPRGATVILVPDDDPNLAESNLAAALSVFRSGRNVYVRHVASVRPAGERGGIG